MISADYGTPIFLLCVTMFVLLCCYLKYVPRKGFRNRKARAAEIEALVQHRRENGLPGYKGLRYEYSQMKKKSVENQARRSEERAEVARQFQLAKSNLKSEVLNYLDNPSSNSMRFKNDLHAIWEKNGFSLTWKSQEIQDVSYVKAGIIMPFKTGSDLKYVSVTNVLTIEELQYPTEEVMNRQWTK